MSGTPRTDAEERCHEDSAQTYVPADFARQLELQLCEALVYLQGAIRYLEDAHEPLQSGADMRTAWDQCLDIDLPKMKRAIRRLEDVSHD